MYILRFRCGVDLVYFVACKKLNLGETLLYRVNPPLLEYFVNKNIGKNKTYFFSKKETNRMHS